MIGSAIQRGSTVYVYNEKGNVLTTISSSSKPGEGLMGFTSSTVSVRRGSTVYTYNERGSVQFTSPA